MNPYFDNDILLVITAAMNYALKSCKEGFFPLNRIDDRMVKDLKEGENAQIKHTVDGINNFAIYKSDLTRSVGKKTNFHTGKAFFQNFRTA